MNIKTIAKLPKQELPAEWQWSKLGDVADIVAGNPAPQGEQFFENGTYPFVRVQDMGRLGTQVRMTDTHDRVNETAIPKLKLFPAGSVLFTKSGASTLLNQRAILARDMYVVSHIAAAIPSDTILSEWLYYWLKVIDFNQLAHATTLPSLPLSQAKEIPVPIAPKEVQANVIAEIEIQFSRLDEAVTSLKRAKANLKRYKAAFLKAAVEGKLTEEWRKQHPDVEPATELLKRILIERRQKWEEAELAKMRAKGKEPKDDKWKARYKEPIITDTEHLQELPSEWMWVSLLTVAVKIQTGPFGSLLHKEEYVKRGVPLVNPTHISGQRILADWDLTVLPNKANSLSKYRMEMGDIVMGRRGEMGRCASVSEKQDGWLCGTGSLFIRLIPHMNSLFYSHFLSSKVIRDYLGENSIGTTMSNLNQNILRSLPIPLCSEAEQDRIMQDVNYKISIIDKLETYTSSNLQEIEILRQSILNKAFSGNLKSKYEKLITGLKTK
ncbi:MAG: restriction endonuclease subunit S [Actinomycetota bacterium]|nr:restriction endonuclease subunit S [Actinomycetota bacterium]MCL6092523.1 restriction endonuclease subunit S [Actinomycetota bacterium]MDA8167534.1 restriction endonuclease subunit S [Actinomycetota bacterium]